MSATTHGDHTEAESPLPELGRNVGMFISKPTISTMKLILWNNLDSGETTSRGGSSVQETELIPVISPQRDTAEDIDNGLIATGECYDFTWYIYWCNLLYTWRLLARIWSSRGETTCCAYRNCASSRPFRKVKVVINQNRWSKSQWKYWPQAPYNRQVYSHNFITQVWPLSDLRLECVTGGSGFPALDIVPLVICGLAKTEMGILPLQRESPKAWKQTFLVEL